MAPRREQPVADPGGELENVFELPTGPAPKAEPQRSAAEGEPEQLEPTMPGGGLVASSARAPTLAYQGPIDAAIRIGRGLGVALAILVFWSGALGLAWFVVPYVYLRERETLARRRRMQHVVAAAWRWFHRQLDWTTLYRSRHVGGTLAAGPHILVANHPSLLDVTSILSRMPEVCCVVKGSLVDSPLVGRLLRSCGHVAAGDGSLMGGMGVLEAVRERLDEGFAVLVFPEGTRSPLGGIRRFRRGAFEIAQRAGVPVVPLFLRCEPAALGKGTPVWRHPRRCPTLTVHVGAAIDTTGLDPAEVCKNVQADFRSRLQLASSPAMGEQRT